MSRGELAKDYFLRGYACAQAVVMAFSDLTGVEEELAMRLALPFGGGLGRLRLTCGAVSGAAIVLGLIMGDSKVNPANKKEVYAAVQEIARRFTALNGSVVCGDLLTGAHLKVDTSAEPEARSAEYYKKRPCPELVRSAAEILEAYLTEKNLIGEDQKNL